LVCRNGHVPPLEPLYDGPYRVLTRSRDFVRLQIGDRTDTFPPAASSPAWTLLLLQGPCRDVDVPRPAAGCYLLLASHGPIAGQVGRAVGALCCSCCACKNFGRCWAVITTCAGGRNHFSPWPGVFCTPRPWPGAAALHTGWTAATPAMAAGQVRPVAQVWGSRVEVLHRDAIDY
jgi:hypothetical protein